MFSGATNLIPNVFGGDKKKKIISNNINEDQKQANDNSFWNVSDDRRKELFDEVKKSRSEWVEGNTIQTSRRRRLSPVFPIPASQSIRNRNVTLSRLLHESTINFEVSKEVTYFLDQLSQDPNTQFRSLSFNEIDMIDDFDKSYEEFLDLMMQPSSSLLLNQLRQFVDMFEKYDLAVLLQNRDPREQPGGKLHHYIDTLLRQTTIQEIFQSKKHLHSLDIQHEVCESFLTEKIYSIAFWPFPSCQQRDEELKKRIASLSFIEQEHLDITSINQDNENEWKRIQEIFEQLNHYYSPRKKMDCILQVCKKLTNLLKEAHPKKRFPSADEFLPAFIYVILKVNPDSLHSNIDYISQYRHPMKLISEPGYFFTHLVSSISFLEHLNDSSLTISPSDFEKGLEETAKNITQQFKKDQEKEKEGQLSIHQQQNKSFICYQSVPSILSIHQERLKNEKKIMNKEHFRYSNVDKNITKEDVSFHFVNRSAETISVGEIPQLLEEYNTLYFMLQTQKKNQ